MKVPMRQCVSCRQMRSKEELIRVVRISEKFVVDVTGRMNGRGAYICKSEACIGPAIKKRAFDRAFRQPVSDAVYDDIKDMINE